MESLVKFLTDRGKLVYVLVAMLGFIIPGVVFIFVWNHDIYIAMDVFQILLLSSGISFMTYIPNVLLCACLPFGRHENGTEGKNSVDEYIYAIFVNVSILSLGMICKIVFPELTIRGYIIGLILLYVGFVLVCVIRDTIVEIIEKFKHKRRKE